MVFEVKLESNLSASGYDALLIVSPTLDKVASCEAVYSALKTLKDLDNSFENGPSLLPIALPSKCIVYSPTGPLNRDYDDVRRYEDAADKGVQRALSAGFRNLLVKIHRAEEFSHSELVGILGVFKALYVPLEIREDVPSKMKKIDKLGYIGDEKTLQLAMKLEQARIVAKDIGGSDPERMAAPRVEEYVRKTFENSPVSIDVISDDTVLVKEYPLFSAVNRCAKGVARHRGRIIYLTYTGEGPIKKTVMLVGKGVTYDTGGADIKAGGVMAGMHRDKCGSAAVAGFMQLLNQLRPSGIKVIGGMAMVRNSVGSECYVADEIITSRSGTRVRVGNTDAEGRMAMGDVLCRMKELAASEISPNLLTIATLTGHCCLALGDYFAAMDNGPARRDKVAPNIQSAGDCIADPCEVSTIRRDDYDFVKGKSEYEDVLQSNNLPSSKTARGHQSPAAFLIRASGLDKHGLDSDKPLKYTHLDIAGSSGPFPGVPTGSPILALAKMYMPELFEAAR